MALAVLTMLFILRCNDIIVPGWLFIAWIVIFVLKVIPTIIEVIKGWHT